MIQTLIHMNPESGASAAAKASSAIDGGAKWLRVAVPTEVSDDAVRKDVEELAALCREAGVILTIDDRPELARETGVHGVHMRRRDISPGSVRAELGAEAIIGVDVVSASAIPTLAGLDIDYAETSPELSRAEADALVASARAAGADMPIVAQAESASMLDDYLAKGYSGIVVASKL